MISGVYCIKCDVNNKVYVGQSTDIFARWQNHFSALENNKHSCSPLQEDYNEYGYKNFSFEILSIVKQGKDEDSESFKIDLLIEEAYYGCLLDADKVETGYNYISKFMLEMRKTDEIVICPAVGNIIHEYLTKDEETYLELYKLILTTYDKSLNQVQIRPNALAPMLKLKANTIRTMVKNLIKYKILKPEIEDIDPEFYPNGVKTTYYYIRKDEKRFQGFID